MAIMEEEGLRFSVGKKVFYNPNMTFCRSMSSLAVGAIERKMDICDAFCASGIRGMRYASENRNVGKVLFVDVQPEAIRNARANAKKLRIKSDALRGNISKIVFDTVADFLEIDPFGTPAPYLYDSFRVFNPLKQAYLSVTATDTAVLCGGKTKACLKNYHSYPMNNEFTHETGLRILVKKIAETAAEFNMGIRPLVSFSDRHYLKTIVEVRRGAELANDSLLSLGYVYRCMDCNIRAADHFPPKKCPVCGEEIEFAGPLWLGEMHDRKFIERMAKLNSVRTYTQKKEIERMLGLMHGEIGLPQWYYNVHNLCRRLKVRRILPIETIITAIRKRKHKAVRTHYSDVSIKTDAPIKIIQEALNEKF